MADRSLEWLLGKLDGECLKAIAKSLRLGVSGGKAKVQERIRGTVSCVEDVVEGALDRESWCSIVEDLGGEASSVEEVVAEIERLSGESSGRRGASSSRSSTIPALPDRVLDALRSGERRDVPSAPSSGLKNLAVGRLKKGNVLLLRAAQELGVPLGTLVQQLAPIRDDALVGDIWDELSGSRPGPGRQAGNEGIRLEPAADPPSPARLAANPSAPREPRREPTPVENPKVEIGTHRLSGSPVYWEPEKADQPLNNFGFLVTGDAGTGKTQLLRTIIHEVARMDLPICVFDFKNDYAPPEFSGPLGFQVYDVYRQGLPFNPLVLPDIGREQQAITHIHEMAEILRRAFRGFGPQQAARLRKAMASAYSGVGLDPQAWVKVQVGRCPSFDDVVAQAREDRHAEDTLNRLSPLFDLGIFRASGSEDSTFEDMIQGRVVLALNTLPTDEIKNVVAEFVVARLHAHILRGSQPRRLRRLLVFDEAWRVSKSVRLQELAREARAFGVSLAVSTQFPDDVDSTLAGNLATHVFLHNKDVRHQKVVARTLSPVVTPALVAGLARLQKFEGYLCNQQHPGVPIRVRPHHEWQGDAKSARGSAP